MATVVGAEEGRRTLGKRYLEGGKQQRRGRSAGKRKKAKVQRQGGDRPKRQKTRVAGDRGARGQGAGRLRQPVAGRGAEQQQAKKGKQGERCQAAVPNGAGARME